MSRKQERIDTSGGRELAQPNPFGALGGLDLPAGPAGAAPPGERGEGRPGHGTGMSSHGAPAAGRRRETLLVRRLTGGKGGKVVTEVSGFDANPQVIEALLKRLQGRLGTGGTVKGKVLELQGECRERVKTLLEAEGYRIKGI